jgi:hypothetical protein
MGITGNAFDVCVDGFGLPLVEKFSDHYPIGQWVKLKRADIENDPAVRQELFDLIQKSYAKIGGHLKIKTPDDLLGKNLEIFAVDLSASDDHVNAVNVNKEEPHGLKGVATGTDGSPEGKEAALKFRASQLKTIGHYAEVSKAMAHIMITHYHVPYVHAKEFVERVVGQIEWVGPHPEGKYPGYDGWYYREIGGEKMLKILVGVPK